MFNWNTHRSLANCQVDSEYYSIFYVVQCDYIMPQKKVINQRVLWFLWIFGGHQDPNTVCSVSERNPQFTFIWTRPNQIVNLELSLMNEHIISSAHFNWYFNKLNQSIQSWRLHIPSANKVYFMVSEVGYLQVFAEVAKHSEWNW
jgi:hypothetical protein